MSKRDEVPAIFADTVLGNPSDDDAGLPDAPDTFSSFLADAQLRGAGADPEGLAQETSQLDARVRNIYSDISERATQKATAPADSLEKRAKRITRTVFPLSGKVVCSEIGDRGEVISTWTEQGEA
jgi:hypothetical protein